MGKKYKLFFSLASLCFAIAILCFGVYSAMSVNYAITGSISYELKDVFVEIETSLYLSTTSTLSNEEDVKNKIDEFQTSLPNQEASDTVKHSKFTDQYFSYENGKFNGNEHVSQNVPINYGTFQADNSAYAYYIVISIKNNADETIHATLNLNDVSNLNSIVKTNHNSTNILANSTQFFIIGMALDDATKPVNDTFEYDILIETGEIKLPQLYTMKSYEENSVQNQYMLSVYGQEQSVDITQESLTQNVTSQTLESAEIAIAEYSLDIPSTTFENISGLSITVSSQSFMYAIVLKGIGYSAENIDNKINSAELTNVIGFSISTSEDTSSADVGLIKTMLNPYTDFTVALVGAGEFDSITLSNLKVFTNKTELINDFTMDHYVLTNGDAKENYYPSSLYGQVYFQNYRIENLQPGQRLMIYIDHRLTDTWAFTNIYNGNSEFNEFSSAYYTGQLEAIGLKDLGIAEAYEPLYYDYSDTENGVFEFCIWSLFFLTYGNEPGSAIVHICISEEPIAAEKNENGGYTVRFVENTNDTYVIPSQYYGLDINAIDLRIGSYGTLIIPNTIEDISIVSFIRKGYMDIDTIILEEGIKYGTLSIKELYLSTLEVRDVDFANNIKDTDISCYGGDLPTIKVKCDKLSDITNTWLLSSTFTQPETIVDGYAIFIPA